MLNSRAESAGRASRKMKLSLMGPAFIAAIGYINPGNFATNIQAGASYGYQLLWVVVWANVMAMLIQLLSAKLGIATGKNLAEHIRNRFPRPAVWAYWVQAEIIAMATNLADLLAPPLASNCFSGFPCYRAQYLPGLPPLLSLGCKNAGKSRWNW